jgi:uncharacterized iron-regulated protein
MHPQPAPLSVPPPCPVAGSCRASDRSPGRRAARVRQCAALAAGCALPGAAPRPDALPAADILLIGEIHDAPGQPERVVAALQALAADRRLAALALEMAEQGRSTAALPADAGEAAVRAALAWDDRAWPWDRYGPVVLAAVRAGAPVLGANLPRAATRLAMDDVSLDAQLAPEARRRQEAAVRDGHCGLMPEARISPIARVQIARDRAMARTASEAAPPGRTVVLLAGAAHADRGVGIPQHIATQWTVRSIAMRPMADAGADGGAPPDVDAVWATPAAPARDRCADLAARPRPGAAAPAGPAR